MKPSNAVQNEIKDTQLIPVHVSWDEILYFNYLQELITGHQQDEDEKTGLRAYPGLSIAIRIPEIREIFMAVIEMIQNGEDLGKDIQSITEKEDQKIKERGIPTIDSDNDKEVHLLDETGEGDDKMLVMMPLDVVHFLDILQGGEKKDPTLGLQEFGLFGGIRKIFNNGPVSSIIRTVATVGGAVLGGSLGGPLGAGAGAAAGNYLGRVSTGQDYKKAIMPALPNALYGIAGHYAAASTPWASKLGAAGTPSLFGGAATAGTGAAASTTTTGTSAAAAGNGAAGAAGSAASSSSFGDLASKYGPGLALIGGGLYLASNKDKKEQQNYKEEKRDYFEDKERDKKANSAAIKRWNENDIDDELFKSPPRLTGYMVNGVPERKHFAKGGKVLIKEDALIGKPIRGKGKGQEDRIFIDVPEKTWIHNATFVSDVGDGSSHAGQNEIEKLEKFAAKHLLTPEVKKKFKTEIMQKPLRKVPCALSDHERGSSPLIVSALGAGSNDKGAAILRDVVKDIRRHKISNGDNLPPASPDLISVYKKVARKHLGGEVCQEI